MNRKATSGMIVTMLLIAMFLPFSIQRVEAAEPPSKEWSETHGGTHWDLAWSVVETGDGGYALAGYTESFGAGGYDFWLVKTDAAGNMEWEQTYGGTNSESAHSVVETGDGGYAITGYAFSSGVGDSDFWLVKTDAYGNMEWNQTYGGPEDDSSYSMVETEDGGYALAGYTESFDAEGNDFLLVKTDAAGNMEWNQTYGRTLDDRAYSMVATGDGGYALVGYAVAFGFRGRDFLLVKTDAYGDMEWEQTYGGTDNDGAHSIVETGDGGYALAGYTYSFSAGDYDFLLVKTDAYGDMEWEQTYGGTDNDGAHSIVETGDGGYALTGYTESFGAGMMDMWLIKLLESTIEDVTPPNIAILSPENATYTAYSVFLGFTIDEEASWIGYSLDGGQSQTISGNITLSDLSDGLHSIVVFASDTAWNTGASETVYFTIETPEPFPMWIAAVIVIVVTFGAALLFHFMRKPKTKAPT